MSKSLFRARRPAAPGYPTREELTLDRRHLLAAGLGARLAPGPLAGCEVRSASAPPSEPAAPTEALRADDLPRAAPKNGPAEPHILRLGGKAELPAADSDRAAPYPEPLGGAPPPPRDPVPPAPATSVDAGAAPVALDGEPTQP